MRGSDDGHAGAGARLSIGGGGVVATSAEELFVIAAWGVSAGAELAPARIDVGDGALLIDATFGSRRGDGVRNATASRNTALKSRCADGSIAGPTVATASSASFFLKPIRRRAAATESKLACARCSSCRSLIFF